MTGDQGTEDTAGSLLCPRKAAGCPGAQRPGTGPEISVGNKGSDERRENSIIPSVSLQPAMVHLGSDPPASIRDGDTRASVLGSRNGAEASLA